METVRDRLLDAAEDLIYRNGIAATGTDAILARAGVARMSLYNQFGSKEALVVAALERRDDRWMAWFTQSVEAATADPLDRLLAIFDVLGEWFRRPDYHGCAFLNVAGERFEADHPVRRVALRHKQRLRACIDSLCHAAIADPAEADRLSGPMFLLIEGAIASTLVDPSYPAVAEAQAAARILIDATRNKR